MQRSIGDTEAMFARTESRTATLAERATGLMLAQMAARNNLYDLFQELTDKIEMVASSTDDFVKVTNDASRDLKRVQSAFVRSRKKSTASHSTDLTTESDSLETDTRFATALSRKTIEAGLKAARREGSDENDRIKREWRQVRRSPR